MDRRELMRFGAGAVAAFAGLLPWRGKASAALVSGPDHRLDLAELYDAAGPDGLTLDRHYLLVDRVLDTRGGKPLTMRHCDIVMRNSSWIIGNVAHVSRSVLAMAT